MVFYGEQVDLLIFFKILIKFFKAKFIPIGYGVQKLQIVSTIEDAKVSVDDDLIERIQEKFSDHVCFIINNSFYINKFLGSKCRHCCL